jgi:adsorption protein B
MLAEKASERRRFKAVVLHDAEDVVHSAELRIFDLLIERFDLVQLPVLPLLDENSRWIAGHYADEFAEAHGKELVVREALGASLPSAGVGCAFLREALMRLTEDYELGLRLRAAGGRAAFVRLPACSKRPLVVTREYFPSTIEAAVAQKARWMTGIALSGWDRLGWNGGFAERWMRLRDRQAPLAALLLLAAYLSLLLWAALLVLGLVTGEKLQAPSSGLALLLELNLALLCWRLAMRFCFVTQAYGWREGLRSIPRVMISNIIAMLAARRAVFRYLHTRKTGQASWDKTSHAFPAELPAE